MSAGTTLRSFGVIRCILGVPGSSATMGGCLSPVTMILRGIMRANALTKWFYKLLIITSMLFLRSVCGSNHIYICIPSDGYNENEVMFIIMEKKFIFTVLLILRSCTRTELFSNEYDVSVTGIVSLSSYTFSFHLMWEARRERHISQIPGKNFFLPFNMGGPEGETYKSNPWKKTECGRDHVKEGNKSIF
jgi:hypothetical protein